MGGKKEKNSSFINIEQLKSQEFVVFPFLKRVGDQQRYVYTGLDRMGVFPLDFKPEKETGYIVKIKNLDKSGKFYNFFVVGPNKPKKENFPEPKNDLEKKEKGNGRKTKKEKFELLLDKIALEAIDFLSEKDLEIKKLWNQWKETGDQAYLKNCQDKIRENWKDFAVHGTLNFDYKSNKVKLRKKPDTDGLVSVGLLGEAGFNIENVKFIKPGEFLPAHINLDTGFKKGLVGDKKSYTVWLDHHGENITKEMLPATRLTYLALRALHFLKENEALKNLTGFVSRIDRAAFPNQEKLFNDSYKMVFGLYKKMNFGQLYDYFKSGKRPDDILSESDLNKLGLTEASKEREEKIANSTKEVNRLKNDGFVADTKFGKIVVDIDHKVDLGYEAAAAAGFDGYLLFDQKSESFFVVVKDDGKKRDFNLAKLNIPQGIAVKNNMIIRPVSEEKLNTSLKEILEKLGANIDKNSKLGKAVNALEIRNNTFSVKPLLSKDKKGRDSYIAPRGIFSSRKFFDKMAIFPFGFRPEEGKSYDVRVKYDSNPRGNKGIYILEVLNNDNKLNVKNMSIENFNLSDEKKPDVDNTGADKQEIPKTDMANKDKKGAVANEKNIEIHETKKEKLERLRKELKDIVFQREPKREERLKLQKDIKNLESDIQKHREGKLEIMKDRKKRLEWKKQIVGSKELAEKEGIEVFIKDYYKKNKEDDTPEKYDKPEKKEKYFKKLEVIRQKEAKKFLERKFRELTHAGKTKEAAELADKAASAEEIGRMKEKIQNKISDLEKEADAFFNAGRKEEAKAVIKQIEDLDNQIKNMKAESFDSRNIKDVQGDAEEAFMEFKKHKEKLKNLKPFFKPSKKAYIGHVLTIGLLYGINVAYLYFKYRKPRLIEKMEYKTAKREYQKTKKDLLVKLVQEITKESNYYAMSERLSRMIGDEREKTRKNILKDIFSLYKKLASPILDIDLPGRFLYKKRKVFINTSLAKIKSLAGLAQKTGLI